MSYCRCGDEDSDVYVYASIYGGWEVQLSYAIDKPKKGESYSLDTHQETLDKLLQLRSEGYKIPEAPLERLRREIKGL